MAVFIAPVDVTPGTAGSWQDVDVSALVPSGASGVILHAIADGAESRNLGFRRNGGTDNVTVSIVSDSHSWWMIGVDAGRIFEAFIENTAMTVLLVGYTMTDAVFFTNGVSKLPSGTTGWQDIDISADTGGDTAIGAVFECSVSAGVPVNFRNNGSTDNRQRNLVSHGCFVVGVDGSEICEAFRSSASFNDCRLIGYLVDGWSFHTNAVDRSLGSTGAYADITLTAGAIGGVIEVTSSSSATYALRADGSSEDETHGLVNRVAWSIVEAPSAVIEGKISTTSCDFFEIGIALAAAPPADAMPPPFLRRDHPALLANLRR